MENITIYTQSTCGYCKAIKDEFTKNNIEFQEKLTTEHSTEWNNIVGLTGMPTTPTVYYKGNYFIPGRDFGNAENLINIIKNYKQSEFQMPFQVLEKVKTMNYNMATAFQRLDQLLRTIEQKLEK
jgi:glutaredoxin